MTQENTIISDLNKSLHKTNQSLNRVIGELKEVNEKLEKENKELKGKLQFQADKVKMETIKQIQTKFYETIQAEIDKFINI